MDWHLRSEFLYTQPQILVSLHRPLILGSKCSLCVLYEKWHTHTLMFKNATEK